MLNDIQQKLQKSLSLHQSGHTDGAIEICKNILTLSPTEPNTLQLLGVFTKAKGDYKAAEKFLLASLKANPRQPHVHNNLGNLYYELDNIKAAIHSYEKATALQENYADAWFNWAIALEKQEKPDEAMAHIKKAIKYNPKQAKYHNLLGLFYKHKKDYSGAIKAFETAIKIQPGYLKAIHNLGTAYRENEQYEDAKNCFNFVLNNKPDQVETWEAIGSLHQNTEDFDRSIVAYHKLLALEPENLKIHRVLNNMMWETGRHDGFLNSYIFAIQNRPESQSLVAAYADELAISGARNQAIEVVEDAIKRQGKHPELFHRLAQLRLKSGDLEKARHLMEKTLKIVTDNDEYYTDFAELLLEAGEYDYALEQVALAEKINPDFQKAWSIRGDCWRLKGDERYHWLCDYENLVQPMEIKVPDGFANIEDFNQALEQELTKLHITDVNPRDQTLIGGTQTIGDLYLNHSPIIQKLRIAVLDAALRYINALPDDETHPHLRRKTDMIQFAGAWSVRLKSEGFHVNHYHSKGWISGPYYVKLPKEVSESTADGEKPGWVNFGASCYGPAESKKPERIIKPQAGLQVFFPSYMWHGTNAFHSEDIRMTAPCDIVPR